MQDIIKKTIGGLSFQYYFRQLFFGAILAALVVFMILNSNSTLDLGQTAFLIISTLLYPYSRFVYESIVHFFMGDNVFFVNAILMLTVKLITIAICWSFAIFIAPLGLAYLYYYHSKSTG